MANELTAAELTRISGAVNAEVTKAADAAADAVARPQQGEANYSADAAPTADTQPASKSIDGAEQTADVNVLHDYVNFTYLVTLHMMSQEELSLLNKSLPRPGPTVIIASAGLSAAATDRRKGWNENFFIEDLSLDTIIGLNAYARGSNAVQLQFKIIEPNGVSLLERMLQTSMDLKYVDFKDMIYVVQLDFTGYDSDGKPTAITGHTKFIPINITGIGFKVTERGAEYDISAVPYNHLGLTQLRLTVPTNISVTASTVSEYFTDTSVVETNKSTESARTDAAQPAAAPTTNTSTSFMTAINKFERKKVEEGKQEVADIYNVVFHASIKDSKLSMDASQESITSTSMNDTELAGPPSPAEIKAAAKAAELSSKLDDWFIFGSATGSKESFLKLVPALQTRMLAFAKQWYSTQRVRIKITSAFRTAADQQRIYEASRNGQSAYRTAQPGKSKHEKGLAVDIDSRQANWAEHLGLFKSNGLYRPYPNDDPVHIIMVGEEKPADSVADSLTEVSLAAPKIAPTPNGQIKYGVVTTEINSGTILVDEINKIVRNSEFCLKQLPETKDGKKPEKPMIWWKVVPTLELLAYDNKRKTYGKKITYYVNPYNVYSSVLANTPSATPPVTRKYQYMFTGQNLDIRDFNLVFNTQFYLALSINVNNLKATAQSADAATENQTASGTEEISETTGPGKEFSKAFTAVSISPVANNVAATAGSELKRDGKSILAGDIQEMLLNQRGGDMIAMTMTILGDPAFIKQDDICIGPTADSSTGSFNGSFPTDEAEVYLQIEFKTPVDIGDETGLMELNGESTKTSKFSGLYRLISVNSSFSRGEFVQKLEIIRIFTDTIYNQPTATAAAANERE